MDLDVNSIFYWWPIVKDLGVPVPRTTLVKYDGGIFLDKEENIPGFLSLVEQVGDTCDEYGYPVFIRCGGLSGKHDWKNTCYVEEREGLAVHIARIMEEVLMIMGVRLDFDGIAVREFLKLEHKFKAFWGEMPVGKEFRFFARDGEYECHHPYWMPVAIQKPSIDDWLEVLMGMWDLEPDEFELLKGHTATIATALDEGPLGYGWWSLDFCKTIDGTWYLTDLGTGKESEHWPTCPYAPDRERRFDDPMDPKRLAEIMGPTKMKEHLKRLKEKYESIAR